jgi:hypothetical protein
MGVCGVVGVLLFGSQLAEISARSALRGYDNTFNYLWLRSAMVDGDWDFRNDLEQCNTLTPAYRAAALGLPVTSAGRVPNKYGVGWSLVTLPFYLVADGMVAAGRWLGLNSLERDGFNPVYQICIQMGHALLALVSLLLAERVVRAWVAADTPVWPAVVALWAASPLLYYQTVDLSMSHGVAFFAVALLAWALVRAKAAPRMIWPWVLAGAAWGLAVVTRFQLAIFGLLAVPVWLAQWPDKARLVRAAGGAIAGAAPLILLQLWAWHAVYGHWLVFSYGVEGEGFHWRHPEFARSLFSPWHGLFYWHPFLLVATLGLFGWAWRCRGTGGAALVAVAGTAYVNAAWWCWWFGSSFGLRAYDAALLPLMAGLAWLLRSAARRWRTLLWGAAILAGAWNFYVALLYRSGAISRSQPVMWGQMVEAVRGLGDAMRF